MPLYELNYNKHGKDFSVLIRCALMDEQHAWHWVACDAGVGTLLKSERDKTMASNREKAIRYGITNVSWRKC